MTKPRWRRSTGVLLLLPLGATLAGGFVEGTSCDFDCGDQGRGYFILALICTPLAALGVRLLGVRGLLSKSIAVAVLLVTLVLAGVAIAAGAEGIDKLTSEPETHMIGRTEPSAYERRQAREDGIAMVVLGGCLGLLATGAGLSLRAAWRKRR
jgi:hypothetical protein